MAIGLIFRMKSNIFLLFLILLASLHVNAKDSLYFNHSVFKGFSYEVKIANGKGVILYYRGGSGLSEPESDWCDGDFSNIELDAVMLKLKKEGVFKWRQKYHEPFIRDGEWYRLNLVSGDVFFQSRGINKFPKNFKRV